MTNNKYDLSLFQMAKQEWLHDFNIHSAENYHEFPGHMINLISGV
jgi:hypothetical protein